MTDAVAGVAEPVARRGGSRLGWSRRTWLPGSRTARAWSPVLVASGVGSALAALVVASFVGSAIPGVAGRAAAIIIVWLGMLFPVVIAVRLSRPRGLFRFRAVDLLYGAVLGVVLRLVEGWLERAAGASGAFPALSRVDGRLPQAWEVLDIAGPAVVSPVVEELFFRGLVLVGAYAMLRKPFGAFTAALVAGVASTALFTLAHVWGGAFVTWDSAVAVLLLAAACSLLTVLTGRIWAAIIVHVVYNVAYAALLLVGTLA